MSAYITDTKIVELRKSRKTISFNPEFAWQDGASDVRDLYESHLAEVIRERDELRKRLSKAEDVIKKAYQAMDDLNDGGFGPMVSVDGLDAFCACQDFLFNNTPPSHG